MRCRTRRWLALLLWLPASLPSLGADSVPKDLKMPAGVSLAVYMPAQIRRFRGVPGVFESGRTLEDTVLSAGQDLFAKLRMAEPGGSEPFGLLLSLHPQLKNDSGKLTYTMEYAAFAEGDEALTSGAETLPVDFGDRSMGGPLDSVSYKATRKVMIDVLSALRPEAGRFPEALDLKTRSLAFAVKKDKPWATGTGFFINAKGQLLTAAHVVANCARVDVKRDGKTLPARVLASSNVVDLAALDTGQPVTTVLPFRSTLDFELGEPVTGAGFPLQDLLSDSPNLTRGNVSARGGLTGSSGQLQFSAPTQPGSSGGPVVSDGGEILGVTVGTLNPAALAKQGVIPQNINFALEARYAARFLEKNQLEFSRVPPNPHGDLHTANQAALGAIAKISCYE